MSARDCDVVADPRFAEGLAYGLRAAARIFPLDLQPADVSR